MQIETNICKTDPSHDYLRYPPIEKQVMDLFIPFMAKVEYRRDGGVYILELDGTSIEIEISKTGAILQILQPEYQLAFEGGYPSIRLGYNKEIDQKVAKFSETIHAIQILEEESKVLLKENVFDREEIEDFLKKELSTPELTVALTMREQLFYGTEILFYIYPRGHAPAEGVMVCIEKGTNKIEPYWNGSTKRRKQGFGHGRIEQAAGDPVDDDLKAMKERIELIGRLQAKIDAFDPRKCQELAGLIDLKARIDIVIAKYRKLIPSKKE
jgi:hypothetical protein